MLKPMSWMIIPSMLSFSTLAFAGGVPTDLPAGANSSGKTKTNTTKAPTEASKVAKAKSMAAKKVAKKLPKLQQPNPKRSDKRRQIMRFDLRLVFGRRRRKVGYR